MAGPSASAGRSTALTPSIDTFAIRACTTYTTRYTCCFSSLHPKSSSAVDWNRPNRHAPLPRPVCFPSSFGPSNPPTSTPVRRTRHSHDIAQTSCPGTPVSLASCGQYCGSASPASPERLPRMTSELNLSDCNPCRSHRRTKTSSSGPHIFRRRAMQSATQSRYTPSIGFRSKPPSTITIATHAGQLQHNQTAAEVIFAADQPADLPNRVSRLLPTWQVSASKKGITREFTFNSFAKAWKFMTQVANECTTKRHHPSWSNLYNKVTIEWTTHSPEGLSSKDVEMAEFCDRSAHDIGLKH